jgi:serine/threonine protein kinase
MTSPVLGEQLRPGPEDSFIGRTIAGKWRIERKLGAGGMGTVFLATDLAVDRQVALKFLLPALAAETEYRARFEKEARVMAKVDHPNLMTLYGVERDGEVPFLVMKYVPGRTLAKLIKDRVKLSLTEAMPLVKQMCAALTALHAQGYVHRDLKPGNIIVSDDGQVTLLDFGLIRSHDAGLTRPGMTLGSPFYMSPEQAMGDTVDARSDLYTLGVVLTELLTGQRPFTETDAHATLLAHLEKPPIPAHELDAAVPQAVSEVLLKALEKRPHLRQQSIAALMAELHEAAAVSATMVVAAPMARQPVKPGPVDPTASAAMKAEPSRAQGTVPEGVPGVAKKGDSGKQGPVAEDGPGAAAKKSESGKQGAVPEDAPSAPVKKGDSSKHGTVPEGVVGAVKKDRDSSRPGEAVSSVKQETVVESLPNLLKKGDSGKQSPVEDGAKKSPWDQSEATVAERQARPTKSEWPFEQQTDVAVPVVRLSGDAGTGSARKTTRTGPVLTPQESAQTLVGLEAIDRPSQQTLSGVSDVTPSASDPGRTMAAIPQVDGGTDPSAEVFQGTTVDQGTRVAPPAIVRRTWFDEGTPSWVFVGIGGGTVLIIALLLWIVFG